MPIHPIEPPSNGYCWNPWFQRFRKTAAYSVHERREIESAILSVLRSGCPWRMLPHEFPAWGTVYYYFRRGPREGIWDQILRALRMQVRRK